MKHKFYVLLLSLYAIMVNVQAQNGFIAGSVKDSTNQETLIGVVLNIAEKQGMAVATDLDGNFVFSTEPGTYTVNCSYVGYKDFKQTVTVTSGDTSLLNIALPTSADVLGEVKVVGVRRTNSEKAVILEIRNSEQVVSAISSEQIAKSQDRDAAQVIQRTPGITIVENRFVMVRGLSERYNAVMLNGAYTPSTEVDSRAFSFDIVPSSMIDRLLIYKSGAPELPGDFAGAAIKIITKSIPDENSTSLGISTSYRNGTTFKDFKTNDGNKTNLLGFSDQSNNIPSDFPTELKDLTREQREAAGKSLPNNYGVNTRGATPDIRANFNMARRLLIGDKKLGFVLGVNYSNSNIQTEPVQFRYEGFVKETGSSSIRLSSKDNLYANNIRFGIINNYTFQINENHRITFKNIFNQISNKETVFREGKDLINITDYKSYSFQYETRGIYSSQLQGSHDLGEMTNLSWTLGFSLMNRDEPDTRRMRYTRDEIFNLTYRATLPLAANPSEAARFFSKLNEKTKMGAIDFEHSIRLKKGEEDKKKHLKVRTGIYLDDRSRNFAARFISYVVDDNTVFNDKLTDLPIDSIFNPANIGKTGFNIKEGTSKSDSYTATNKLMAGYIGTSIPFLRKFNLAIGVRVENNIQGISSFAATNEKIDVRYPITSILPSTNLSYNITEKLLIRGAYYKSLNRPEFRELAPFTYYDFKFLGGSDFTGNPNLKVATIDNLDARLELYPSDNESVSIGGFYKKFTNPIERYALVGSNPLFTFGNALSSESYGVELEARKSLNFLTTNSFVRKFSLLLNTSIIKSKLVNDRSTDTSQVGSRPMQGQSPYIVNAGIYFNDTDSRLQFNILYNVFGERLYAIGNAQVESIFELPKNVLDFTITKGFGKHLDLRFGIQDILNQAVRLKADSDQNLVVSENDEMVTSFKRGSYYTLGLNFKF